MDVVSTVLFDGQFWIAIIEKTDGDGRLFIGKHRFGSEPTNGDLIAFYSDAFASIRCLRSDAKVRVKPRRSAREEERISNKAKEIYKNLRSEHLRARKSERNRAKKMSEGEKYSLRREKKKEKKRGR